MQISNVHESLWQNDRLNSVNLPHESMYHCMLAIKTGHIAKKKFDRKQFHSYSNIPIQSQSLGNI